MRNRPQSGGAPGLVAMVALVLAPGCFTMQHTLGNGPTKGATQEQHQWYALFGLVAIGGPPDGAQMLDEGSSGARITTQFTVLDVVISAFTSFLSFYRQTITVEQ